VRVVTPSVNCAAFLEITLPVWRRLLSEAWFTVVTSAEDTDTQRVARDNGVHCFITDAWKRVDPTCHYDSRPVTFNKALALDEAFGFWKSEVGCRKSEVREGDLCLSLDADCYPFGEWPWHPIELGVIYSCARYHCPTLAMLAEHIAGTLPRESMEVILPRRRGESWPDYEPHSAESVQRAGRRCLGFFQLFRYRPGLRFGSFPTAGKYDLVFRDRFSRRVVLQDFYVLHLGEQSRAHWRGHPAPVVWP